MKYTISKNNCWLLWADPSSDLVHSNKTPKGHHFTQQQVSKHLDVSLEVTMAGVQIEVPTLIRIQNELLRLSYT